MIQRRRARGLILIVSAPSGSGKTTVCRQLLRRMNGRMVKSVSCTTRLRRAGEIAGRNYRFLSKERFRHLARQGFFVEWAAYAGNLYGTPRSFFRTALARGKDVLLEIEVQGAAAMKRAFPQDCVSIFLLPPSWRELKRRLSRQQTDSRADIRTRLAIARREIRRAEAFDYLVVNDTIAGAADDMAAIVTAERCASTRRRLFVRSFAGKRTRIHREKEDA